MTLRFSFFALLLCLLPLTLGLFPCSTCQAATYYVDATNGNDTNDGLSPSTAWKTIAKVNNSSFDPGDQILFKRGEIWREQLTVPSSGQPENPITFGAYGSHEAKPMINLGEIVSGWKLGTSENLWSATSTREPQMVLFDGAGGNRKPSVTDLTSNGEWHWSSNNLYIYSTTDPRFGSTEIESVFPYPSVGISSYGNNYVSFEVLDARNAAIGFEIIRGRGIKILNCDLKNNADYAIFFENTEGDCEASYNTIYYAGNGIYLVGEPGNGFIISHNEISYCNYDEVFQKDGAAIGIQSSSGHIVEHNLIHHCLNNIEVWAATGKRTSQLEIRHNVIRDSKKDFSKGWYGAAIRLGPEDANGMTANKVHHNLIYNCNWGISTRQSNIPPNIISNNTIYDCRISLFVHHKSDYYEFKNNIIADSNTEHVHEWASVAKNIKYDSNCYSSDGEGLFVSRGKICDNFAIWQKETGQEANSFIADPLFTDPANNDFRLLPGSPCIDTGEQLGFPFNGPAPDIGAYEHTAPLLPPRSLRVISVN